MIKLYIHHDSVICASGIWTFLVGEGYRYSEACCECTIELGAAGLRNSR